MCVFFQFILDFDFTAARGIGSLNKELSNIHVPLFLLKASKEIVVILKESTNTEISTLDNPDDLETLLEQSKYHIEEKFSHDLLVIGSGEI